MSEDTPLGLYIHWPYCARICPYCDFNVYRARDEDGDDLLKAMIQDLKAWADRIEVRALTSIHFGGGTPSLLKAAQIEYVLDAAQSLFGFQSDIEMGLEANPKEWTAFEGFKSVGINRLSLGVQTFRDQDLSLLGRDHDGAKARQAYDEARRLFDRTSLDLIYARPGQSLADWDAELKVILSEAPSHLSAYQLTIEDGTAFERRHKRGEVTLPDDAAEMYELTRTLAEAAGLSGYEISNYARSEADQSVHNRLYWEGADWIGIGPGAHSRVGCYAKGGRVAGSTVLRPDDYIQAVDQSGSAQTLETLTALEEAQERILMGLRLSSGLDIKALQAMTGYLPEPEALQSYAAEGRIVLDKGTVRIAPDSRIYADRIAMDLAPED